MTANPEQAQDSGKELVPATQRFLIPAPLASALCSMSEATWWRLNAAAKTPCAVKLGGKTLWNREELQDWANAGCPPRAMWEAMRQGKKK